MLDERRFVPDRLQQPYDAVAVLRRAEQHRTDQPVAHLLGEVLEDLVARRRHIAEQLLHQLVVVVGKLLEHVEARFLLASFDVLGHRDDFGRRVLAIDEGALEREIDEAGRDAVLPYRDLAQHQRLGAGRLQHRQDLAHLRLEAVDLVEEEEVGDALILELLEDQLQRGDALGIRLADHDRRIARRQHRVGLGLELDRSRAVDEGKAIAEKFDVGDVDLDAHAVVARFRRAIADRVLVGDLALARHGAGAGQDGLEQRRLAGEVGSKDRDGAGAARCTAVGIKPHGFLLVAQAQGRVPRPAPELRQHGTIMLDRHQAKRKSRSHTVCCAC